MDIITDETQEIIQYNILIATMILGAREEQWYPPNKDSRRSGKYYILENQKFFPGYMGHCCGDYALSFHKDWSWAMETAKQANTLATKIDNTLANDYSLRIESAILSFDIKKIWRELADFATWLTLLKEEENE